MERMPDVILTDDPVMRAKYLKDEYLIIAKLTDKELNEVVRLIERYEHPPHYKQ